uniref:Ribosomal RNA-processing protein 8 n=1 Tax=Anopheles culicifacies TaxID=139723 RepID=A0A182M2H2_9DIPT
MSKLFNDCDWEDDLPTIGTNFRFAKGRKLKKQKKEKLRLESQNIESGNELQNNESKKPTGWSVLLKNSASSPEQRNGHTNGSSGKKNNQLQSSKRKSDDTTTVNNSKISSKKLKPDKKVTTNGIAKHKELPPEEHLNGIKENAKSISKEQNKTSKNARAGKNSESLTEKLTERLKGSRFRFINEQLYKIPGEAAQKLFQEDPESFDAYHAGYRQQVEQWPLNPLNRMIKCILKLYDFIPPKNTIVADFGCGEAKLAASVPHKVYSLDLMSNHNGVIACDMANTPLESNFVNVVIFCLSLMGTNLADFFLEANRVLKVGGLMKIAEVSSRFDDVNVFISNVKKCGFTLENKDLKHTLFYFFNFKKERTVLKGSTNIKQFSLKPCLYKKR